MLQKLFTTLFVSLMVISSSLSAELDYEIHDIDTLQTRSSQAIALNNKGQILGWYNLEKSDSGKQFFVRNRDGVFYELPSKEQSSGLAINWQYLTDNGKAYGTFDTNSTISTLCVWDQQNGIVKLGVLPGNKISAINNAGQVLIKSIVENKKNGRSVRCPVIWQNGQITKLKGLGGDLGINSDESYGLDMNNKGEVVGQSLVYLSYKNTLYTQIHATKWVDGQAYDLHNEVPKAPNSYALAINDHGDVLVDNHLIRKDGKSINMHNSGLKMTDSNYLYKGISILDRNGFRVADISSIKDKVHYDKDSIWWALEDIISLNDSGEIITKNNVGRRTCSAVTAKR